MMSNPQSYTISSIPVYAICLDREVERKEAISKQLNMLGITPTFIGIDGKSLHHADQQRYDPARAVEQWGRELSPGEIGCYASHRHVWTDIASKKIPLALVIESDALITHESMEVIRKTASLSSEFDMAVLLWGSCVPSFWGRKNIDDKYILARFSRRSFYSSGYLLTLNGARELLSKSNHYDMPVDELLLGHRVRKNMHIRAVCPMPLRLIDDADETSVINDEREALRNIQDSHRRGTPQIIKSIERGFRHFILKILPPPHI